MKTVITLAALSVALVTSGLAQATAATAASCGGNYCWSTESGAADWLEKFGATTKPGMAWAGTENKSHLSVYGASCRGVARYGSVRVSAANMTTTVNVGNELDAWDGAGGPPVGERAYKVLRCYFTDGRGRKWTGLYSSPKDSFIG